MLLNATLTESQFPCLPEMWDLALAISRFCSPVYILKDKLISGCTQSNCFFSVTCQLELIKVSWIDRTKLFHEHSKPLQNVFGFRKLLRYKVSGSVSILQFTLFSKLFCVKIAQKLCVFLYLDASHQTWENKNNVPCN